MTMIHAYAATEAKGAFKPFEFDAGPLGPDEVEIEVMACGICHSDLSMLDNDWGMTDYPFVGGHEVVGKIAARGDSVGYLEVGQTVGLGWVARSCLTCHECLSGHHHLCQAEATIVGRHGGFADRVRCQATWAIPLPDGIDAKKVGPMFCGGLTVFNGIVASDVKPTDRVGVIGIGGLGHMALRFLNKWGCEVTAFTSTASKGDEARKLGAHNVIDSRSEEALDKAVGSLDFIISTVNVTLAWDKYLGVLKPRGRLHTVGAVPEPLALPAFPLILGQRSVSGSPVGSPAMTTTMLEFCARHGIEATTEHFPMDKINDAFEHLRAGKARYRIVLER